MFTKPRKELKGDVVGYVYKSHLIVSNKTTPEADMTFLVLEKSPVEVSAGYIVNLLRKQKKHIIKLHIISFIKAAKTIQEGSRGSTYRPKTLTTHLINS